MKRLILFIVLLTLTVAGISFAQEFIPAGQKFFPTPEEFVPPRIKVYLENKEAGKKAEAVQNNAVSRPSSQDEFFFAGNHLNRFFADLNDLEKGKRKTVRVMHFGDSLMWGETFAVTMRRNFQKDFGNGGRGLVPVIDTNPTKLLDHVNLTSPGEFKHKVLIHRFRQNGQFIQLPPRDPELGFTGESAMPIHKNSTVRYQSPSSMPPMNSARIFFHGEKPGPYTLALKCGETDTRITIEDDKGFLKIARANFPECRDVSFSLAGERPVFLDAVSLESGGGIIYDSVIRMGTHMAWIDIAVNRELIAGALREINPSLIMFQYGVNECASIDSGAYTVELYHEQMKEWLSFVRRTLPKTDILLIGPLERLKMVNGSLQVYDATLRVRDVQIEESKKTGYAFFDTYRYLGGPGHMKGLVAKGWAVDDYTHLTQRGGHAIASSFYDILMGEYRAYQGNRAVADKITALEVRSEESMEIQFNSLAYLYFLLSILIITLVLSRFPGAKLLFLVAASYYFYMSWKIWPGALLAGSTLLDYFMGIAIDRARLRGSRGTPFLIVSLIGNLGLLFIFKYFDFLAGLTAQIFSATGTAFQPVFLNTVLPVGISFYTFQTLSYSIDVWRGEMEPEKNFLKFSLFVSFFPQLVAGPIVRAKEFLPGLNSRAQHFSVTPDEFYAALFLIGGGLLKKMGADWLAASIVDRVFAGPGMFSSLEILAAVLGYGLQIYGDFSGYTDIALGSAKLLGFNLTENFDRPYQSRSVTEFWRRWHISLGGWFRDYLYISLGGNRKRVYFNLMATMFLCGLWHGAGINFVLWGVYYGLFLMVERIMGIGRAPLLGAKGIAMQAGTLGVVLFGWIIFRSPDMATFSGILWGIARFDLNAANITLPLTFVIIIAYLYHVSPTRWREALGKKWSTLPVFIQSVSAALLLVFLYQIQVSGVKPFIYFQF